MNNPRSSFLLEAGSYALDPVHLQRIMLVLLRAHYSDPKHFGVAQGAMENFIYSADPVKSRMAIVDQPEYGKQDTDLLPAINVQAQGVQFRKHALGNTDPQPGKFGLIATTVITCTHYARTARETLALACFTMDYLIGYQEKYIQQIGAGRMNPSSLSPVQPVTSTAQADKVYQCTFSFDIEYDYSWTQQLESHLIQRMSIEVGEQLLSGN